MDAKRRRDLAHEVLDGYVSGAGAPLEATASALTRAASARAVVLVEGISDQIAVETLAGRLGRDLGAEGVVTIPIGGAQAISRYLTRFGPTGADLAVTGLCDAGEEDYFRSALAACGMGSPQSRAQMEECGFFVCAADLEEELIRASDPIEIKALLASQGDLGAFQTLQKQSAWRDRPFDAQIHRWLRAGSRRNLRYARLLIDSLDLDDIPRPLHALLAATV